MTTRSVALLLCAWLALGAAVSEIQADPRGRGGRGSHVGRPHVGHPRVGRPHVGRGHPRWPHAGRLHSGRTHLHFGFSFGFPFHGHPYYGFYPWYPYAYHLHYAYYPYGPGWAAYAGDVGFVDLDVEPEDAEVWAGDWLLGTADDFDGYPDLLPLRAGRRIITLRHPGYEDLKLRLEILAGTRIRIRRDMVPLDLE
jgi:hypothetical protein